MKHQTGFSLVELMVAMLLGLVIVGAATQLFIANQQAFVLQQTLARVQEDGQLFTRFLVADLRRAGLENESVVSSRTMGVQFTNPGAGAAYPVTQEDAGFDRLTLGFHGTTDCEGSVSAVEMEVINTYEVSNAGELRCTGNVDAATNGVVLLTGVEAFELMYGIDRTVDGYARAEQFVNANQVAAFPVVAVRFAFLLSEDSDSLPEGDGTLNHYVLTKTVTEPKDRAVRRLFTATVKLRNFDWDAI